MVTYVKGEVDYRYETNSQQLWKSTPHPEVTTMNLPFDFLA